MKHLKTTLLPTIVGKSVKPLLLGLVVLVGWGLLATVVWPLHQIGFALVPPNGTVSAVVRSGHDRAISGYLIDGREHRLAVFSPVEQSHLADVRWLLGWLLIGLLIAVIVLIGLKPRRADVEPTLIGVLGLGFSTLLVFPVAFEWFHQVAFLDKTTWYLPADAFLLTQLYPEAFFAVMWLLVVLLAAVLLLTLWRFLAGSDVAR